MKKGRRESKRKTDLDQYANLDSGDELGDGFAAGEYRIALQPGPAAAGDDEDSNEEAVYDLDDEDEDDEDSADDVDVLEAALLKGGKAAQLAKQARYLEQKLKLQQGELDDDDDDDDEQQEGDEQQELRDKLWGANKQAYYQTDDAEGGSDNEALAEEEAEVRRLQQQQIEALVNEDYGVTAQHPAERSLEQVVANGGAGAAGSRGVEVETVTKDLGALTAEEQVAVVMADAPELLSLLDELQACLTEVRGRIGPLLREVAGGGLATTAGLSYLEAKHLMLLQYCMCIVAYLMLKAEGKSVKDHPVIGRLVQLRAYIEKIRPIDKQLAYQIDKLLRATSVVQASSLSAAGDAGAEEDTAAEDALQYRPNPQRLITKAPLVGDAAGLEPTSTGVYRPPKLNPVAMDEDRALSNKEMRKLKEAQRRAKRSVVLRELAEELEGAPEEVREEVPGMDTAAAVAARHRLEARAAAEEELMLRVPLSKQEANKLRAERRAGLSGAGLADFADDVADIVAASSAADGAAGGSSMAQLYGKHRMSQRFGADLALQHKVGTLLYYCIHSHSQVYCEMLLSHSEAYVVHLLVLLCLSVGL
eukprot:GHRR01012350.1.p1 GENE.GHRR01012350.1~~GHRR01012350.1.p1  ORF type:complete len:590 (+),score=268.47 GHRR01012350.1:166-1935(+)